MSAFSKAETPYNFESIVNAMTMLIATASEE